MVNDQITDTNSVPLTVDDESQQHLPCPGLLIAHSPTRSTWGGDRCSIRSFPFLLGRDRERVNLPIADKTVSGVHCRIIEDAGRYFVEDLNSKNGTYLDGSLLVDCRPLIDGTVLRIGESLAIWHENVMPFLDPPLERFGFEGRFHVRKIVTSLQAAAFSGDHILLAGPSGSGKELAASALRRIIIGSNPAMPYLTHNAADYGTEDEALATLLGVAKGAYTGVSARSGLVEGANGGVLFIDEFHRYSNRIQESLLRGVETGEYRCSGTNAPMNLNVRFILATSAPPPEYGIVDDFRGRLQIVDIPSLADRRADIPTLFQHLLKAALSDRETDGNSIWNCLTSDHHETLCINQWNPENIRGLIRLANLLVGEMKRGTNPHDALRRVFYERFGQKVVSSTERKRKRIVPVIAPSESRTTLDATRTVGASAESGQTGKRSSSRKYDDNKRLIEEVFFDREGNISAAQRILDEKYGLNLNYHTLAARIKEWGLASKISR